MSDIVSTLLLFKNNKSKLTNKLIFKDDDLKSYCLEVIKSFCPQSIDKFKNVIDAVSITEKLSYHNAYHAYKVMLYSIIVLNENELLRNRQLCEQMLLSALIHDYKYTLRDIPDHFRSLEEYSIYSALDDGLITYEEFLQCYPFIIDTTKLIPPDNVIKNKNKFNYLLVADVFESCISVETFIQNARNLYQENKLRYKNIFKFYDFVYDDVCIEDYTGNRISLDQIKKIIIFYKIKKWGVKIFTPHF